MTPPRKTGASKSLRFGLMIAMLSAIATGSVFWFQVQRERRLGLDDLTRRAQLLSHRLAPQARLALQQADAGVAGALGDRLDGHLRLLGMAVYRPDGSLVASGDGLAELADGVEDTVRRGLAEKDEADELRRGADGSTHVFVQPLTDEKGDLVGAVAVLHDALYLEDRMTRGMVRGALWSAGIGLAMLLFTTGLAWAVFERPLVLLAEWMRRLRFGNTPELPPRGLPVLRLADETAHLAASFRAARSQEREAAQEIVR